MTTAFHEVLFPLDIALKSAGGPERRTEIVAPAPAARSATRAGRIRAGATTRATASRRFEALSAVVAFFEERRGRLHGFRWRDRLDHSSAAPGAAVAARPGDRHRRRRDRDLPARQDLRRRLRALPAADRQAGARQRARRGRRQRGGRGHGLHLRHHDRRSSRFLPGHIPAAGAAVTAGFLFDVPVRFDTDYLEVDLSAFAAGAIPKIPLVEIKP